MRFSGSGWDRRVVFLRWRDGIYRLVEQDHIVATTMACDW